MMKPLVALALVPTVLLTTLTSLAGELQDRVDVHQTRTADEYRILAESRRAQSHTVFEKLVTNAVNRSFGGMQKQPLPISAQSSDGGPLYMVEILSTQEFKTQTNLVCHAWGTASCRKNASKCNFTSTRVQCVNERGIASTSDWLDRSF